MNLHAYLLPSAFASGLFSLCCSSAAQTVSAAELQKFWPTDWLKREEPLPTPYFPQQGDKVRSPPPGCLCSRYSTLSFLSLFREWKNLQIITDGPVGFHFPVSWMTMYLCSMDLLCMCVFLCLCLLQVVYCRQGHEAYVDSIEDNKVYRIDNKMIPWKKKKLPLRVGFLFIAWVVF